MMLRLYSFWRSSASYRVRIALNLKGIPYELVTVNIAPGKDEQKAGDYKVRNPMQQVPTLEIQDPGRTRILGQSLAIIEYLEEMHPKPALLPRDAFERALVRQCAEIVNAGIQPLQNLGPLKMLKEMLGADRDLEWIQHWNRNGLLALESIAKTTAGQYLVGDHLSIADICLVPQMYSARRFEVDMNEFPTLVRIDERCRAMPEFAKAAPEVQPDAPPQ